MSIATYVKQYNGGIMPDTQRYSGEKVVVSDRFDIIHAGVQKVGTAIECQVL